MKSDFEITRQFKDHFKQTQQGLSAQYENTRKAQAFYAGDSMSYRDSVQFSAAGGGKKRAVVQFSKVKPYVNAVKGFMAQNRRKAKYVARMNGDQAQELYSQYGNSLADYVREQANSDQVETQADGDNLVGGYAAVETAMSYGMGHASTDPNGQILIGRLDPLQVGWDPFARETNLLDARWAFYQKDYALSDALELFEDSEEEDFSDGAEAEMGDESGYSYYAGGGRYNAIREGGGLDWSDEKAQMVKVYFYQWFEYETFFRADNPIYTLQNPQAVQMAAMELDIIAAEMDDDQRDLFSFDPRAQTLTFDAKIKAKLTERFGDFLQPHEYKRKVFYTAVLSRDHVFTSYRNVCQQGFTTKFKTGDFDAKNKIWTGMVNSLMEPVTYYNKALTELMFTIGANSKGGVLIEEDAVEDIQKFEAKYAKTDSVVVVRPGALSGGKIQPKRAAFAPTGYEAIIQMADAAIPDSVGVDKAFLGSSENKQETGLLQSRRIRQVVSTLACYFDSITLFQKEHARLLLDFLYVYAENNSGGLFRVIGDDGRDQFLQIGKDKLAAQYDVVINEAPQSPEEKQEFATIISDVAKQLLATDPASAKRLFAIGLKYLPLERADQQEILQILTPQSPQIDPAFVQQLQQQLQAATSQAAQAEVKKKFSEFALNMARVDETRARVGEINAGATQKRASAFHDVHEALLDEHMAAHEQNNPSPQA